MSFAEELEKRIVGGKFRLLNEKLYKQKKLSEKEIKKYHEYFEAQTRKWPSDPRKQLADMIGEECPGKKIADIGCGTGVLGKELPNVQSFDKYPAGPGIIKGEIEALPVEPGCFEVAVHCLSLMSTFVGRAVAETNRILLKDGFWYVLEVRSRLISIKSFINGVEKMGFKLHKLDTSNPYFVIFVFQKKEDFDTTKRIPDIKLNKCLYKKR